MSKREIILWMNEQEYDALRRALLARDTDPRAEMQKRLEACYRKLVPKQERDRIAKAADRHRDMGSAVFRVIEDGKCFCFGVADDGVDTLDTAIRLRKYLDSSGAAGFAAQFTQQMTITEQEYIDHVMECLCDFERPANVLHVDLDGETFSSLDAKSGWWTYPIKDAVDSVRSGLPGADVSREQRTEWLRHRLDGKRIDTDERCLLLRGDRELRASDVEILDYVGTEDGVTTFTLELCTDLETVFGTRVAKDDDTIPQTQELMETLETLPEFLPAFDGEIFTDLVDNITAEGDGTLRFRLKNGLELTETAERSVR